MKIEERLRSGGLAVWSMRHPVGVVMIALAVIVLGAFSLQRLGVNLLPHLIYPEIRVRITDPGVPARIMEDRVTRQLEEQLAITEDAVNIQSTSTEGRSSVDLSFPYGKDIDIALRDASTRLDRAKRFLPTTIEPPVIYKRDPSQIPVLEFVVSSALRSPVELRSWVDDVFAKWFVNLPGVAAAEVGGGLVREIQILPDQQRLAGLGLKVDDIVSALEQGNVETPGGRLLMSHREIGSRTVGRFTSVEQIANLPLKVDGNQAKTGLIHLGEVAEIIDTHEDERLRIRLNGIPGIKLSIQKQPQANTVAVVETVNDRLEWLQQQKLIPRDIEVQKVGDQSIFVRHALNNATSAALSGAILAMLVVYFFLGNIRRTLIIGSAIPIAIMVTFILMAMGGLTLNIMTLGGLALGVGMLVDNTIVMLENIHRHQRLGEATMEAPVNAAKEVNSAIVASTTTNLAAVLPFIFIGGLTGLLFRELIFTISAAIVASLVVALTLVPALSVRVKTTKVSAARAFIDRWLTKLQEGYGRSIRTVVKRPWLILAAFVIGLVLSAPTLLSNKQTFLPTLDEGQVRMRITADPGISVNDMDGAVRDIEEMIKQQPEVETVFSTVGGWVFGRSQYESSNKSSISIQLVPRTKRSVSSDEWIGRMKKAITKKKLPGINVRMSTQGIRGIRLGRGDDEVSLRIQGPDLDVLSALGDKLVQKLEKIEGLRNVAHSAEEVTQEIAVEVDRARAASLGLTVEDVGKALRFALQGNVVTDFLDGDRSYDIRVRLPSAAISDPQDIESILFYGNSENKTPIRLGDVAHVNLVPAPATITRDQQNRIVEVTASLMEGMSLGEVDARIKNIITNFTLPEGYTLYDAGAGQVLQEGRNLSYVLLALALFLVFVVMAVQYESLRNPLVILASVPFAIIGVAIAVKLLNMPLSMPVWLGLIMLAGIVVNNAIVLVEYIELERERGRTIIESIATAARLRLRPILMTTVTTVVGMLPLALGLGEGAEMLQPLAITIVAGLAFSTLVSLVLVPVMYVVWAGKKKTSQIGDQLIIKN